MFFERACVVIPLPDYPGNPPPPGEGDLVTAVARVIPEDEDEGAENGIPATETDQVEALTDE